MKFADPETLIGVVMIIAVLVGIGVCNIIGYSINDSYSKANANQIDVVAHLGYNLQVMNSVPQGQTVKFSSFPEFLQFLDKYKPSIVWFKQESLDWYIVPMPNLGFLYFVHDQIIYLYQ